MSPYIFDMPFLSNIMSHCVFKDYLSSMQISVLRIFYALAICCKRPGNTSSTDHSEWDGEMSKKVMSENPKWLLEPDGSAWNLNTAAPLITPSQPTNSAHQLSQERLTPSNHEVSMHTGTHTHTLVYYWQNQRTGTLSTVVPAWGLYFYCLQLMKVDLPDTDAVPLPWLR